MHQANNCLLALVGFDMNIGLKHTLQVVMPLYHSPKDPRNCMCRVPQFILVDDIVYAQAEYCKVTTEKEPQKRENVTANRLCHQTNKEVAH